MKMNNNELYTITIDGKPDKGEKIPPRDSNKPVPYAKTYTGFVAKHGPPPDLSTQALIKANPNLSKAQPILPKPQNKNFITLAREYADRIHEKTGHVSFMSYWPSYNDMSEAQLNWYFYLRSQLRQNECIQTDLSYVFLYIYELINQIKITNPDEGYNKLINIWKHYRKTNPTLDRYIVEWLVDYIDFYNCNEEAAFELLKKEGLFLLLPTDVLFDHYVKNGWVLPIELITRFCDYKFIESELNKNENEILFLENLLALIHKVHTNMNAAEEGSFEKRSMITSAEQKREQKRIPFQRALFDNPDNIKLNSYPPFERHKPFRDFMTSIVKEYENQLRACLKHKGRLRYSEKLSDYIVSLCKLYAQSAANGEQYGQDVEIKINREKLSALIHDSDEVRKKLLEGNYEYEIQPEESEVTPIVSHLVEVEEVPVEPTGLLPELTTTQQNILTFLLNHGGSSAMAGISAAFPGVFVGVEIDRINDIALETINDLLIGFENDFWYIIEDYINDLSELT